MVNRMRWLPYGATTKGTDNTEAPFGDLKSQRWKMDEKWKHVKNRHPHHFWKNDIFQSFSISFSSSIFHLTFWKIKIKNEIKNGYCEHPYWHNVTFFFTPTQPLLDSPLFIHTIHNMSSLNAKSVKEYLEKIAANQAWCVSWPLQRGWQKLPPQNIGVCWRMLTNLLTIFTLSLQQKCLAL